MLVVGEASDGLEAVRKAQRLQPDLILLDIGLPTINGIEAARRILQDAPKTNILFLSEHRSADIVKEALSTGAGGYIVKSDAENDLLPAVDALLAGKRFVSSSLATLGLNAPPDPQTGARFHRDNAATLISTQNMENARHHDVGFYFDDRRFSDHVGRFIKTALKAGNAAIVVATESHRNNLLSELQGCGPEIRGAIEEGRYFALDAEETLSMFLVDGVIDPVQFLGRFGDLIMTAKETAKGEHPHVSVFGECVHLLWAQGDAEAAIQMEKLGNKLKKIHDVEILCGYFLGRVEGGMDNDVFKRICAEHSTVYSQ